jgi:hypothetical protein
LPFAAGPNANTPIRICPVAGGSAAASFIATPLSPSSSMKSMPVAADHRSIMATTCASRSVIGWEAKPPPGEISMLIEAPLVPGHASAQ